MMGSRPVRRDGAISDAVHRCDLVEQHSLLVELPPWSWHDRDLIRQIGEGARDEAYAWAESHGLDVEVNLVERRTFDPVEERNAAGNVCTVRSVEKHYAGAEWTVVVGRGTISEDQRVPGVLDEWVWSSRFRHWLAKFTAVGVTQRSALHDANVAGSLYAVPDPED